MGTLSSTLCGIQSNNDTLQRRMGAIALTGVMSFSMGAVVAINPAIFCLAQTTHTLAMTLFMDLLRVRDFSWSRVGGCKNFCFLRVFTLAAGALLLHTLAFKILMTWGLWQTMAIYRMGSVPFQAITCLPILVGCLGYLRPQSAHSKSCQSINP